jgi:hypothetical protein
MDIESPRDPANFDRAFSRERHPVAKQSDDAERLGMLFREFAILSD